MLLIYNLNSNFTCCPENSSCAIFKDSHQDLQSSCITLGFCVSLVCFQVQYFFSLFLLFWALTFLKSTEPLFGGTPINFSLSDVSSWFDLGYAFLAGMLQQWCWVLLNAAVYFQIPSLAKRNEGSLEKCLILGLDREGPDEPGTSCYPESKDMLKRFQETAWRATSSQIWDKILKFNDWNELVTYWTNSISIINGRTLLYSRIPMNKCRKEQGRNKTSQLIDTEKRNNKCQLIRL